VLTAHFRSRRTSKDLRTLEALCGNDIDERGATFGERAGFVEDEYVDFSERLERSRVAEQDSFPCAT
jgi:hypothetical protein